MAYKTNKTKQKQKPACYQWISVLKKLNILDKFNGMNNQFKSKINKQNIEKLATKTRKSRKIRAKTMNLWRLEKNSKKKNESNSYEKD